MLARFFVTFLSVLLLSSGCTHKTTIISEPNAENLALYELKGNVKEVTEERFEAIKIDERLVKGRLCAKNVRHFDPSGNLIEELIYDEKGELEECIRSVWGDDHIVVTETHFFDGADNLVKVIAYEYDSLGNVITNTQYDGHKRRMSQIVNTYDNENYLTSTSGYTGTGYLDNIAEYVNDKAGRVIEERFYEGTGELIYTYLLERDERGHIIVGNTYDEDGLLQHTHSNEYDQMGNLTAWVGTHEKELYSYIYDKQGNWIRKEICYCTNNAKYIVEREVIYY